jgi:hypothetical protein
VYTLHYTSLCYHNTCYSYFCNVLTTTITMYKILIIFYIYECSYLTLHEFLKHFTIVLKLSIFILLVVTFHFAHSNGFTFPYTCYEVTINVVPRTSFHPLCTTSMNSATRQFRLLIITILHFPFQFLQQSRIRHRPLFPEPSLERQQIRTGRSGGRRGRGGGGRRRVLRQRAVAHLGQVQGSLSIRG